MDTHYPPVLLTLLVSSLGIARAQYAPCNPCGVIDATQLEYAKKLDAQDRQLNYLDMMHNQAICALTLIGQSVRATLRAQVEGLRGCASRSSRGSPSRDGACARR